MYDKYKDLDVFVKIITNGFSILLPDKCLNFGCLVRDITLSLFLENQQGSVFPKKLNTPFSDHQQSYDVKYFKATQDHIYC